MSTHDPGYLDIMYTYGIDPRRARRVFLHGDMTQDENDLGRNTPETVIRGLLWLDQSPGEIELWIQTDGGDVSSMFGVYDAIITRKNCVKTVAIGEVCSAGCLPLVAGDVRYAMPNSWFMSHAESASETDREVYDQVARGRALLRMEKRWAKLMGQHTKKTEKYWNEVHHAGANRELWLDAQQMKKFGIVDKVLEPTSAVRPMDPDSLTPD